MKKLKLFLSLCMMCLCVAVLCMGILAAGSATYQVNGNISYNMIDGVARVNARVYKVAGTGTLTSDQLTSGYITTLQSMELEDISKSTSPNYILTETKDTIAINQDGKTVGLSANIVYGANTDQSTYYTYFIVLNITNQSSDTGYVLNAYLNDLGTSTISNIASNANGSSNTLEIKSGKFTNIVIGLSYTGNSTTSETFNYTLNVSYMEYDESQTVQGVLFRGDEYYYINLGYTDSTKEKPIRWRMISKNGTTMYKTTDFESETDLTLQTLQLTGGAVFLMETNLGCEISYDDGCYQYYVDSSLETTVNSVTTYNLDSVPSFISPNSSVENDNFWLLSSDEVTSLVETPKWIPYGETGAVAWLTRTYANQTFVTRHGAVVYYHYYVNESGNLDANFGISTPIRSAFGIAKSS